MKLKTIYKQETDGQNNNDLSQCYIGTVTTNNMGYKRKQSHKGGARNYTKS